MPDVIFQCFLISEPSDDEVLKCQSNAAKNRNLVRSPAAWMHTSDDLPKFRVDDLCADTCTARRARCDGEFAIVTDKQRGPKKIGAHFSLAGPIGSQCGYVGSRANHARM